MAGLDTALAGVKLWLERTILIDTVRIALPATGEPVLNTTTGELEYPQGEVLYEGPGAVLPGSSTTGATTVPDGALPWAAQTRSAYVMLTPLEAPVPPEKAIASVVQVHDPARGGLLGRTWICSDPGKASTVEVVRSTDLDQNRAPGVAP
jgi:hypothetical protein